MTEDGFAIETMSDVAPEAMKMKIRLLDELKRLWEQLAISSAPRTQLEVLQASINKMVAQESRLSVVETKVDGVERKQEQIIEILSLNPTEWRKKVNNILNLSLVRQIRLSRLSITN